MNMNAPMMKASTEWMKRPDDQRFTSLDSMLGHFEDLRARSAARVISSRQLTAQPARDDQAGGLEVVGPNGAPVTPTNWSFGQLAGLAGAPAGYLRKLPSPVAADCINWGLKHERQIEDVGVLLSRGAGAENGTTRLAAATGPRYGRIWNADVTRELVDRFGDGVSGDWRVPGEFGKAVVVDKGNTTLYASDRDMFVFLADEKNRVEIPGRRNGESGEMARGFFVWNSEVGAATLGIGFFLFDYICMNRIVWGMTEYTEKRLRHTVSAPDRWIEDVTPVLADFSQSSAKPIADTIAAAQASKIDKVEDWLATRFGARQAVRIAAIHEDEEGRPIESLWDATTAVTALARSIPHNDTRVALERQGGDILDLVAA